MKWISLGLTVVLLLPICALAAEVERVCAMPGYPKKLSQGIEIHVDHTNGVYQYELLLPGVIEKRKFGSLTLHVIDAEKDVLSAPLNAEQVSSSGTNPMLRAFFKSYEKALRFRLDAEYGFPCGISVEQTIVQNEH